MIISAWIRCSICLIPVLLALPPLSTSLIDVMFLISETPQGYKVSWREGEESGSIAWKDRLHSCYSGSPRIYSTEKSFLSKSEADSFATNQNEAMVFFHAEKLEKYSARCSEVKVGLDINDRVMIEKISKAVKKHITDNQCLNDWDIAEAVYIKIKQDLRVAKNGKNKG